MPLMRAVVRGPATRELQKFRYIFGIGEIDPSNLLIVVMVYVAEIFNALHGSDFLCFDTTYLMIIGKRLC